MCNKINLCIEDDNYVIWLWDGEWLRVHDPAVPDQENGYHDVFTYQDVVNIMVKDGYLYPGNDRDATLFTQSYESQNGILSKGYHDEEK